MQDVSCEPLMLCPSENPQANLDIFSQPHHHPFTVLHPSQGDKQGLTFPFLWRTALQAAERHVRHLSCTYSIRGLPHVRQHGLFLFIALMRMVTFRMKVVHKLLVWALRDRSYKTKAEDWAAGHRPPSSSRGLSWFLSCLQQWAQGGQRVQGVQWVQWIILTTVFLFPLHSSSSQYHILISRTRTRNIYIR